MYLLLIKNNTEIFYSKIRILLGYGSKNEYLDAKEYQYVFEYFRQNVFYPDFCVTDKECRKKIEFLDISVFRVYAYKPYYRITIDKYNQPQITCGIAVDEDYD